MRNRVSCAKVELPHSNLAKGASISHESEYNTRSVQAPAQLPEPVPEAELKLIRDIRRRNPTLGMIKLWQRIHNRRSNNLPLRPLHWLSSTEFTVQFV